MTLLPKDRAGAFVVGIMAGFLIAVVGYAIGQHFEDVEVVPTGDDHTVQFIVTDFTVEYDGPLRIAGGDYSDLWGSVIVKGDTDFASKALAADAVVFKVGLIRDPQP